MSPKRWGGGELNSIPEIVEFLFKGKEWNGDLDDYPYYRKVLTVFPCVDLPEDNPPDTHQIFERVFQLSQCLHAGRGAWGSLGRDVWEHPRKAAVIAAEENLCMAFADLGSEYQAMLDERLEGIPAEQLLAWTKDMVDEIVDEPSNYIMRSPLDRPPPKGDKGGTQSE